MHDNHPVRLLKQKWHNTNLSRNDSNSYINRTSSKNTNPNRFRISRQMAVNYLNSCLKPTDGDEKSRFEFIASAFKACTVRSSTDSDVERSESNAKADQDQFGIVPYESSSFNEKSATVPADEIVAPFPIDNLNDPQIISTTIISQPTNIISTPQTTTTNTTSIVNGISYYSSTLTNSIRSKFNSFKHHTLSYKGSLFIISLCSICVFVVVV